jgi:hypothetical protein
MTSSDFSISSMLGSTSLSRQQAMTALISWTSAPSVSVS